MTFEAQLRSRNAADYADFLEPHLAHDARVLDTGCGSGTLAIGLAERVGGVVGVDLEEEAFAEAQAYARQYGIGNAVFRAGSMYALPFPGDHFDACLCHSVLEALDRPMDALLEIKRTLKPGSVLGVASVEYGGLILAGPHEPLLRRFYAIREQLWQREHAGDPYRGRRLRGLLLGAGFERVVATTKAFSYGTPEAVRAFGFGRAADCRDDWYASMSEKHGLATRADRTAMEQAWLEWVESPEAYAAFAWCRTLGWKPEAGA